MIKKIAFVGYPVRDEAAAAHFFGELLGLEQRGVASKGWLEFEGPDGKTIALDGYSPEGGPVYLSFEVEGIEARVEELRAQGVEVVKEPWDNQVCKMALIKGPGDHVVMLHEIAPERAGSS